MRIIDQLPPEDQDWCRFRQLKQLGNHWERPGWVYGRRSYHWFFTFECVSVLHTLAAQCQELFRDLPQFDLVPLETLHLTIQRLGFTDELPAASMPAAIAAVKQRCRDIPPFRLGIGWLAGSTGAIRFTTLPMEPVVEIRDIVLAQVVSADVSKNAPTYVTGDFWPHVSIAYSNTAQPIAPIATKIEGLRSLPVAEVLITSLALVELRREDRVYRWDELERVGIGR